MPTRETPQMAEAYREYLRLGIKRSYQRLHDRLREVWGEEITPSVDTLRGWSTSFGWNARVIEDDELINRRALERIRDRLAHDAEERRSRRLQLSDIQMNAAMQVMVVKKVDKDTLEEVIVPVDLTSLDPSMLRAINDTIRLASETQRLDMGEATSRFAGEEMTVIEGTARAMGGEVIDELRAFVGLALDTDEPEPLMLPDTGGDESPDDVDEIA